MKIAVVIDTWFPEIGGGQTNAWEISRRIASTSNKIDIITRNNKKDNLRLPKNLKVIRLSKNKLAFQFSSLMYLISHDYKVIHAHAFIPGITARLAMIFKGTPALFTVHGTSIGTNLLNPISKFVENYILTKIRYSAQITVSRDFLDFKNINKDKFYITNGTNYEDRKSKKSKRKTETLLYVGRFHKQKNLENLILAMEIVKQTFPKIILKIVGSGLLKRNLLDLIKKRSLRNNIILLENQQKLKIEKLYKTSTLLVLTSIYEGQPLVLLDAMALKLPVVAAKVGDIPFIIKDGKNGFLIHNQFDPENIATTIIRALKSNNLNKVSENATKGLKTNYNWNLAAQQTLKLYEKAAKFKN